MQNFGNLSRRILLVTLSVCCFGLVSNALADLVPNSVQKILKRNGLSAKNTGLYIAWDDGTPIAQLNLDKPFNPASAIKAVTSMVALSELGPSYTWETSLLVAAPVVDGSLRGDLYFRGSGDPFFTSEKIIQLIAGLKTRGIDHVAGEVVVDDTEFNLAPHDPTEFDGKGTSLYNAGAGAAVVNFGASQVVIRFENGKPTVFLDPPSTTLKIENKLRVSKARCSGNWRARLRERLTQQEDGTAVMTLSGSYATGCGERSFYLLAQNDSVAHAAGTVEGVIEMLGGKVEGGWRQEKTPRSAKKITTVESLTLGEILRGMNKHSNNFMAKNVFLSLAKSTNRKPYTIEAAREATMRWFKTLNIKTDNMFIDNGSGLSRNTRITPRQFGDALYLFNKTPYRHEFIASLAILGKDGTVKKWNSSAKSSGKAHVKTGTLKDTRTTVGYVHNPTKDIVFVVFAETKSTALARRAIQELLELTYVLKYPKQS